MSNWITVGKLDEIPRLGSRVVETAEGEIALFRANDDRVFALRDACPHKGGPLSQGMVFGHSVACPLHNWSFDLATGEANGPDEGCAGRYETKVEGGEVLLQL